MDFTALLEQFLNTYGLLAIFAIMLLKEIGVPVPIPADLIILGAAARSAAGKEAVVAVFLALLIPMVVGGAIQYWIARGPGRAFIYRIGRFIGLTQTRLDRAMATVRRGGTAAVAVGLTTPGVRIATTPASGLADLTPRVFVPGLVLGSAFFLAWHFAIGYVGGFLIALLDLPAPALIAILIVVLIVGVAGWWYVRRSRARRAVAETTTLAESYASWADASCPACIA
ncbi:MAG: hypothetical protein ABI874_00170, partial [Chloroflexota bacterium]